MEFFTCNYNIFHVMVNSFFVQKVFMVYIVVLTFKNFMEEQTITLLYGDAGAVFLSLTMGTCNWTKWNAVQEISVCRISDSRYLQAHYSLNCA